MLRVDWLTIIFAGVFLLTGIRVALLTPMGQLPDEPSHIARADGLIYGQILGYRVAGWDVLKGFVLTGVATDTGIAAASTAELSPSFPLLPLPPAAAMAARNIPWGNKTAFEIDPSMVEYMPSFYLPAAIGIAFGHATGARPLQALFDGRLAMLASYLLMGVLTLRAAAFGAPLLFTLLLLPTPLVLGASFNQDGQLIAAMALACALLTRDAQIQPWTRWAALTLIMLVTCSKPPYGLLMFAAAAPLAAPGLARRLAMICLFGIPPVLWLVLMERYSFAPWIRLPPYHPGPLWHGARTVFLNTTDPAANMHILLTQPAEIILLPVRFMAAHWMLLGRQAIGVLGWGPLTLAPAQYGAWILALGAALLACFMAQAGPVFRWPDRLLILVLLITSMFAMELSIYVSWCDAGAENLDGPTGRYFLLFVPFVVFFLDPVAPAGVRPRAEAMATVLTLPAIIMAAQDIFYLPNLLISTFHMAP